MAFPEPYTEKPADIFFFDDAWWEHAEDSERSSSHFADEQQEATLIGYVPWNKRRSAVRFFKGFATADDTAPWRIRREQPHRHPVYPWLRCHAVSFSGMVIDPNVANPNYEPFDESDFSEDRSTRYRWALTTVHYKSFKNCRFLEDGHDDVSTATNEWRRNTIIDPPQPMIEALTVSGGLSQLIFSEDGPTGPSAGVTRFTAPLAERQLKLAFRLLWLNVPWPYLTENDYVFRPTRFLDALGKVNEGICFTDVASGFKAETLYFGGLQFSLFPWWVPSDDLDRPLVGANVLLDFHHFDPSLGAATPYRHGWNAFPWGGNGITEGDGLYYRATRDGTNAGRPFIETTNFNDLFKHVLDV